MNSNNNQKASSGKPSASGQGGRSNPSSGDGGAPSRYGIAKDGWDGRAGLHDSYGIPPGPERFLEGDKILDAFQEHDRADAAGAQRGTK